MQLTLLCTTRETATATSGFAPRFYISRLVGTPGYRHTIGIARVWHFINVHGFIITGIIFAVMLGSRGHWDADRHVQN